MNEKNKQALQKRIRSLTKLIGEEKSKYSLEEASNYRAQRERLATQLIEQYDTYYIIRDGKTEFVSKEQVIEHYSNPDVKQNIAATNTIESIIKQRTTIKNKLDWVLLSTDAEVRKFVEDSLSNQVITAEHNINHITQSLDMQPVDFNAIDDKNKESKKLLEGIDFSSLLENYENTD